MSTKGQLDALAAARSQNRKLGYGILLVAALGALGMYFAWALPKSIDLHLAPDIRAGDTLHIEAGLADVPAPNVYGFAYYIWQQVNRWQSDGAKDYGQQIFRMQSYITPGCRAQLQADMEQRARANELKQRTRRVSEVPGLGFASNRVIRDGDSAWTVLLDMQLTETFRGAQVKETYIRYPIRVVRYDVDRERNPWRLAIDCYGTRRPARLDTSAVQGIASGQAQADLPTRITPVALPQVSDEVIAPDATPEEQPQAPRVPADDPAAE